MSLVITWQDRDYNVDPTELSTRELDLIYQRTSLTWPDLIKGGLRPDPNTVRALFWVIDQRADPNLKFSDYDGPSMRVWLPHLGEFKSIVGDLGKLMTEALETNGSGDSPSTVDTAPESSTT